MKKHYKKHIKVDADKVPKKAAHLETSQALFRKFESAPGPIIVAVGGPGGTGKTTFAAKLALELKSTAILHLDDYKTSRSERAQKTIYGPHPEANRIQLIRSHLAELKKGKNIEKPVYCRDSGTGKNTVRFSPEKFVIAEGEVATYRDFFEYVDFSIFIDSHWKTQLNTRIRRDIEKRGYSPKKAIASFLYSNLHEFPEYGLESKNWSDIHIHCDENYSLVIDAVCSKSAAFMIDRISSVMADTLYPS